MLIRRRYSRERTFRSLRCRRTPDPQPPPSLGQMHNFVDLESVDLEGLLVLHRRCLQPAVVVHRRMPLLPGPRFRIRVVEDVPQA